MTSGRIVEAVAKRAWRAQYTLREKRGIDERLPLAREVHEIRRRRIDGVGDRAMGQRCVVRPETPLARLVRRQLEPRREPGHQSPDRLQMRNASPIRRALLDWHACFQRPAREIVQHRIGESLHDRDPVLTIAACCVGWLRP